MLRAVVPAALLVLAVTAARPRDLRGMPVPAFWAHKLLSGPTHDIVLLGDSRTYRGLSPEVMAAEIESSAPGLRIFNFGFSSVGLTQDYAAAGAARLDPASPRATLVLGVTPLSLTPRAAVDNGFIDRSARSRRALWLDRWLGIVPHVLAPLPPRAWPTLLPQGRRDRVRYVQDFHADGWVASDKIPARADEAVERYRSALGGERVSPAIVADLVAQVAAWQERGITVFALRPPTSAAMRAAEAEITGFDEQALRAGIEAAGGHWIAIDPEAYASYDGSHIGSAAARALSADVARAIVQVGWGGDGDGEG